jgi:DNA topoisomerase-1
MGTDIHRGSTVCRKCYSHPAVLDTYLDGGMEDTFKRKMQRELSQSCRSLQREERALMHLPEVSMRPAKRHSRRE